MGWNQRHIDELFHRAGVLEPRWHGQYSDTMDSHRLVRYATSVGRGEAVWEALSRKYFEGKTGLPTIRLDDHALLIEAAVEGGVDAAAAARVLADPSAHRAEVDAAARVVRARGVNSIPVLLFSCGAADGEEEEEVVHHGSGSKHVFAEILRGAHRRCRARAAAP